MRREAIALAAAGGLCLLAGGGWLWAVHEGRVRLAEATTLLRAGLGPGGSLTYATSVVRPLARGADLSDVALRLPGGPLLTAQHLSLSGAASDRIRGVHAEGLRLEAPQGGVATAATLDVHDVVVPPLVPGQPYHLAPDGVFFSDFDLAGLAAQASGGSVRLADLSVDQYGPGRATTLRARAFEVPLPRAAAADLVGVNAFSASGVALADLLGAAFRGDALPRLRTAQGQAELDGLFLAHGAERPLQVARIVASGSPAPNGAGSTGSGAVEGLVATLPPAVSGPLDGLLPSPLRGEMSWTIGYDPAGGLLHVSALRMAAQKLAVLTLALELAHLDAEALPPPGSAALPQALLGVQLRSARLGVTDEGVLDVLLRLGARRTGLPPDQLRAATAAQLDANPLLATLLGGAAGRAALLAFLAGGGALTATLAPPVPVTLGALAQAGQQDPAALASRAGLTLTRTAP